MMKQLICLSLTCFLLLGSCTKTEMGIVYVHHAIVACGSELDKEHDENAQEWADRVLTILDEDGIQVYDSWLEFEEIVFEGPVCGNCLPTGDQLFIKADESLESALQPYGFSPQ
jgi:hypothetical protein